MSILFDLLPNDCNLVVQIKDPSWEGLFVDVTEETKLLDRSVVNVLTVENRNKAADQVSTPRCISF